MLEDALFRLRTLLRRRAAEEELDHELQFHFDKAVEKFIAMGLTESEARRGARLSFGGVQEVKEECREARGTSRVEETLQDLRYAVRGLRRNLGMTAVGTITLALGIGASTLVFSIVQVALLRPLPFRDSDRLVQVWETRKNRDISQTSFAEGNFWDLRAQNRSFQEMAASTYYEASLTGAGPADKVTGYRVTAGFFRTLGVTPILGRDFLYSEVGRGFDNHVAILGERFWKQRFGRDPKILGKMLRLNNALYTIIGIVRTTEPWLDGQVYVPFGYRSDAERNSWEYSVIARLAPGVSVRAAEADLARLAAMLAAAYPKDDAGIGFTIDPSSTWTAPVPIRTALWVLLGAVAFLLLIAAVNTANLLLARGTARQRELAIRTALGASRRRLMRLILMESLMLSAFGAAIGVLLAFTGLQAVRLLDIHGVPRLDEASLNVGVLGFTVSISLLTGLLSGAAPAVQMPSTSVVSTLRESERQLGSRRQVRIRSFLMAAEVALAFVLLVGAGLLIRTFNHLMIVDRGFHTERRLVFSLSMPQSYSQNRIGNRFLNRFFEQLSRLPDVVSVGAVSSRPMEGGDPGMAIDSPKLAASRPNSPWAAWRVVTPGYFKTVGLPIVRGRIFRDDDRWAERGEPARPFRVMISARLANLIFPKEDPIGKHAVLWRGQGNLDGEVIGVVADSRERGPASDVSLTVYIPYSPSILPNEFFVHTRGNPLALAPAIRKIVGSLDPEVPVADMRTFDEIVSRSVAPQRFNATLLTVFSGLASLLAATGIYGVLSYSIGQRTSEIGLRMAMGASGANILRMTIAQGMRPALIGLCAGAIGAWWLSQYLSGLLVGVHALDPLTYAIAAALLVGTALLACYVPALRALRTDPNLALRTE
jgi:putative ABC transport system permease protein